MNKRFLAFTDDDGVTTHYAVLGEATFLPLKQALCSDARWNTALLVSVTRNPDKAGLLGAKKMGRPCWPPLMRGFPVQDLQNYPFSSTTSCSD